MGSFIVTAFLGLAAVFLLMTAVWVGSLFKRDASIVDIFWGLGFVLAAWVYYIAADPSTLRAGIVVLLVSLWGLRLSGYILWRNWGEGEDYRYREMRQRHPETFARRSLFTVFWLQAGLLWAISIPLLAAIRSPGPAGLSWLDIAGIVFFAVGIVFEAGGDWQMARFKSDPANKGKVLDSGLWRYTRHPNYFGDAMVWWGLFLFAAAAGAWWTVYSPSLMTALLMKVSGVTLLERNLRESKPGYREYIERTNAFFPWRRKDSDH